jgi:hypothetical protein
MRRRSEFDFVENFIGQLMSATFTHRSRWQRITDWIRRLV